ncbi:CcdB family protein [Sphingomonas sp. DG1-23]|uniref:CcdB family protein n=1 Tax=Sphingomonas sp. DG1-23 TaxID=3068316 RepID=UPI00273F2A0C|nr:CcdB family protein [Sphingomonas sp. DG1-23]MDP5278439.1 CcdB family protein [Sphingomonas sp. DG1-23]
MLLDCQADLLSTLNTRFVVPLLPRSSAPPPAERLNPIFTVAGEEVVMFTQFAAAVRTREFGKCVRSLSEQRYAILNALDLLISGI